MQGLEVEVQRLITRHRGDLEAANEKAVEQTKLAVEAAKAEHELQLQALRETLRQVREKQRMICRSFAKQQVHAYCQHSIFLHAFIHCKWVQLSMLISFFCET